MKLLGYWGVGQKGYSGVDNQIYSFIRGAGSTKIMSSWKLAIMQQNHVSRAMDQNRGTAASGVPTIVAGKWQRFEAQMILNTIGQANGVLRVWIDGLLTHEYTDVVWRTAEYPSGFYGLRWHPIWGGGHGVKTRDDFLLVDHLYLSGIRLAQ